MKDGQGWAKRVTLDNLHVFSKYLRSAEDRQASNREFAEQQNKEASETDTPSPFQGEPLKFPNRFSFQPRSPAAAKAPSEQPPVPGPGETGELVSAEKGHLLWRKKLNRSDAQQAPAGTNPTGCLRLTQAKKENPTKIDQTTFFRDEVFGNFSWEKIKDHPFEEAATVPFNIKLNGKSLGVHDLQVRHKPSGEAGQGNYTTSLHWGKALTKIIRKEGKPGQTFELYAPVQGIDSPFSIEIA